MRFYLISFSIFLFTSNAFAESNLLEGADLEYGQYLSSQCSACHHKQGAKKGIPNLNALNAEEFVYLLKAYRSKKLKNAVMRSVAGQLDDEQIASLALYFTSGANKN